MLSAFEMTLNERVAKQIYLSAIYCTIDYSSNNSNTRNSNNHHLTVHKLLKHCFHGALTVCFNLSLDSNGTWMDLPKPCILTDNHTYVNQEQHIILYINQRKY